MKYHIKAIAETAGVSMSTVSRVLNGKGVCSRETVRTVEAAMEKLGFGGTAPQPPPETVGVVTGLHSGVLATSYSANLLSAIVEALALEGCNALVIPLPQSRMSVRDLEEVIGRNALRGLLLIEFEEMYGLTGRLDELSVPVVCLGNVPEPVRYAVGCDNRQGGCDAAEYLWSLGHRRIGVVSLRRSDRCQQLRLEGIGAAFRARGGRDEDLWFREYYCENDSPLAVAAELKNMADRPTAVITTFSSACRRLTIELSRLGLSVPGDVSLLSFVNHDELADTYPVVTAVCQPVRTMGEAGVRMLAGLMRRRGGDECSEVIPCRFSAGESCTPPQS